VSDLFLEDCAHEGRVTLPGKSLRGFRALKTSSPLRSIRAEYSLSIIQSNFLLKLHIVEVKPLPFACPLVENISMLLHLSWAWHLRVSFMKPLHLFLWVVHTLGWFPSILMLHAAFPVYKVPKLFHRFIPSSNLSLVRNDITFEDPFYLPL